VQCLETETNKIRAPLKLIFERLRDRMEVRFSPLFFILIDLCEYVFHEKMSRTPLENTHTWFKNQSYEARAGIRGGRGGVNGQ